MLMSKYTNKTTREITTNYNKHFKEKRIMKKSYLMIAAAVLTFAACSNNELINEINVQNEAEPQIGFAQNAIDKTTRAELTMDWFHTVNNGFGVYGYKNNDNIFKNEEVYLESASETIEGTVTSAYKWAHETVRFWDKSATTAYNFYAYAPFYGTTNSTTGANPTFTSNGFVFSGLSVIQNITTDGVDKAVATAVENIGYGDVRLHGVHSNSPTVQFTFNHILSKLSFKIMTTVVPTTETNGVADITVKRIKIDFPSAASVTWTQSAKNNVTGATSYDTYAAKTGNKTENAFETTVFTTAAISTYDAYNTAYGTSLDASQFSALTYKLAPGTTVPYSSTGAAGANAIGETFIVTPVNGTTVTKHEFDVQVVYDIAYADGTEERDCVATGTVGTGDPSVANAENVYAPAQNQYYIAVINIKPTGIEFCVEAVGPWNPNGQDLDVVDVRD